MVGDISLVIFRKITWRIRDKNMLFQPSSHSSQKKWHSYMHLIFQVPGKIDEIAILGLRHHYSFFEFIVFNNAYSVHSITLNKDLFYYLKSTRILNILSCVWYWMFLHVKSYFALFQRYLRTLKDSRHLGEWSIKTKNYFTENEPL